MNLVTHATSALTSASAAERQADRLRRDLAGTLDQIAVNLTPSNLASEASAAIERRLPPWARPYWAFLQTPGGMATVGTVVALGIVGSVAARRRRRPNPPVDLHAYRPQGPARPRGRR